MLLACRRVRHPDDHAFLAETFGPRFVHVTITTLLENRRKRVSASGADLHGFERAVTHPVEANIPCLQTLAHHEIRNDGALFELAAALDAVIEPQDMTEPEVAACP